MKRVKAISFVFFITVLTSIVLTFVALYIASKVRPPSPGSFSMISGVGAALVAGALYGTVIGIPIGLISSIFYVGLVQNLVNSMTAFWVILAFSFLVGLLVCLFLLLDNGSEILADRLLSLYMVTSGTLTALIPLSIARYYFSF